MLLDEDEGRKFKEFCQSGKDFKAVVSVMREYPFKISKDLTESFFGARRKITGKSAFNIFQEIEKLVRSFEIEVDDYSVATLIRVWRRLRAAEARGDCTKPAKGWRVQAAK